MRSEMLIMTLKRFWEEESVTEQDSVVNAKHETEEKQ